VTVYYRTDKTNADEKNNEDVVYLNPDDFDAGTVLIKPESSETLALGQKKNAQGGL